MHTTINIIPITIVHGILALAEAAVYFFFLRFVLCFCEVLDWSKSFYSLASLHFSNNLKHATEYQVNTLEKTSDQTKP